MTGVEGVAAPAVTDRDEACGCGRVLSDGELAERQAVEMKIKEIEAQRHAHHLVEQNERLAQKLDVYKRALREALDESGGF